mmetsp:Transcript_1667/g.3651  ORF Transcript_1667/g.3651 Transcript_1667/m.3651 type:complete len:175 (-) Transcript_1667:47-571(-)
MASLSRPSYLASVAFFISAPLILLRISQALSASAERKAYGVNSKWVGGRVDDDEESGVVGEGAGLNFKTLHAKLGGEVEAGQGGGQGGVLSNGKEDVIESALNVSNRKVRTQQTSGGSGEDAKENEAGVALYPWESKLESDRVRCPVPDDDNSATSFLKTQHWARKGCLCPVCA